MGLQRSSFYYWLKFTMLGRLYSRFRYPGILIEKREAKEYYGKQVPAPPGLVFDIGANVGTLSQVFKQLGFRVVACEPDPANFLELSARFRHDPNVIVLQFAVSDFNGTAAFFQSAAHGRSLSTLNEKRKRQLSMGSSMSEPVEFREASLVRTITLDSLIKKYGRPHFIKIDVEGAEKQVLEGLSEAVKLLSFEANLPAFSEETMDCIVRLHFLSPAAVFNCSCDDKQYEWEEFVAFEVFVRWFRQQTKPYFEIFCRMPVTDQQ